MEAKSDFCHLGRPCQPTYAGAPEPNLAKATRESERAAFRFVSGRGQPARGPGQRNERYVNVLGLLSFVFMGLG